MPYLNTCHLLLISMTATIIGATGLIGNYLLNELLSDTYYDTVRVLLRRPVEITHPKLEKKLVDFNDMESVRLALEGTDVIFCTVGTTQKKVNRDKAAYRKVDYDIPVHAARLGKLCGCETFVLVSAAGASSRSSNFYLKLKGKVEDAVKIIGIRSVHIMQPSILLGDRKEFRLGEKIGKVFMSAISFLLPAKYRPVHARDVATAMIGVAKENRGGFFCYEYSKIKSLNHFIEPYRQHSGKK
jgi:uncharacterized protein YbjT (DUF2867 family)